MYDLESARGPFCMIVVSVFTKKGSESSTGSICSERQKTTGSHLHQHCEVFGFTLHFCSLASFGHSNLSRPHTLEG